ncbi:alpha-L-rhamnosidase [Bifidobacterium simiarum]|nr:alpha-L-rhamnosidase [Bifidobacterium simiarum]
MEAANMNGDLRHDAAGLRIADVRFGHSRPGDVIGFASPTPAISWRVAEAPDGWRQAAAQIAVIRDGRETVTDLAGVDSVFVDWPVDPLISKASAAVRVRVAGSDGRWSDWSDPATVECGPLNKADWSGRPISPTPTVKRADPAPVMVRRFTVGPDADDARLHITAGGVYVVYLDGRRIGHDELAPGWTEYGKRICAFSYDITDLLTPGEHEIAVILGNGWYRGQLTWGCRTNVYGDDLWLLADLDWHDRSGSHTVATDDQWHWRSSGILSNDLYDGQITDTRLPLLGDDADPANDVTVYPMPEAAIVPAEIPPARIIDTIPGQKIIVTPSGKTVVDFGQNVSGWVRMTVRGAKAGDRLILRHAEVMEHGELGVRPLRNAKAIDEFILNGEAEQIVEPQLTQHGFRYVQVDFDGEPAIGIRPEDLVACVVSADMDQLADFECSDPDVNRLFLNARWSAVDNFLTVPTDCPQRDERLGWTGDIAVFAPTAVSLLDAGGFLSSWLVDMAADQGADGGIPVVIPDVLDGPKLTCGWGDACVLVPWAVYRATGDATVLKRFLPMMSRFIDGVDALTHGTHRWEGGFQFGDWLDPDAPPEDPGKSKADSDVVATAYFAHSTRIVAESYAIVGDIESARRYRALADNIADAYRAEYVTANGRILSDSVTVYAQAIMWDLLATDAQRDGAGARLADLVRIGAFHISTGFLGTPLVCPALVKAGHADLAMRMLLQRGCPSWLYPVSMGATTIWERWDSMMPDGSINPGEMTSFNHYALGAVAHWLLEGVAGIESLAPAWRRVRISPIIADAVAAGMDHAKAVQRTPYGELSVSWRIGQGTGLGERSATIDITVPVGVTAQVVLPDGRTEDLDHGRHTLTATVPAGRGSIDTVRDLLDDADLFAELCEWVRRADLIAYSHGNVDSAIAKGAAASLNEPVEEIIEIVSGRGYMPQADKAADVARAFVAERLGH